MGIVGAAVATILGQTVSMFMALYFNIKKNQEVRFAIKKFAVNL